ncbi:MAG TPA: NAD(P)-dependent oxidoreductase [Actinomycetota bacterium]|nr:NAD(P)-dependent oxidoreductase [Actinomycetota bacterium]
MAPADLSSAAAQAPRDAVRKVAVVGTGRMGAAMVRRLAGAGFELVVWNRDRTKAEACAELAGAEVAPSAAEAAAGVDVLITSLADDAAVRDVYAALSPGFRGGTIALEMSTIAPDTVREIAPPVEAAGAALLDAPVSGSVVRVESGELGIMVGGDETALERARPVLDALATKVIHMGPLGTGAVAKLAVNSIIHSLVVSVSEALVLAERAGVERSTAYEVFVSGAAAAPFVLYKRAAFEHPDDTPVAFSLDLVAKDLDLILDLAGEVGAPMVQAETNRAAVAGAVGAGLGARDMSALAEFLRKRG